MGKENIYVTDGESVDDVDDYKSLIEDLFALTKGELTLKSFSGRQGEERVITLVVDAKEYSFSVEDDGWIDNINFVKGLNSILIDRRLGNRFYFFWAADSFGQEIGFFFADLENGSSVIDFAVRKNESVTSSFELVQVSDGVNEEGFQDL
ncbi:MAG: hypothetical protein GY754_07520 [bacterium]|nr:hypothetical protein [bacterium]